MKELWQHITEAADISLSDVTVQNGWGWGGGGAWEGEEGSHGMLLDAWDELLGIRIQPAVDLGKKKKTLVTSPEVEPSSPLIGRRLDSPP